MKKKERSDERESRLKEEGKRVARVSKEKEETEEDEDEEVVCTLDELCGLEEDISQEWPASFA